MDNNTQFLLHTSLIKDIGPAVVLKILKTLFDDFKMQKNAQIKDRIFEFTELYQYKESDFAARFGITRRAAQAFVQGLADRRLLDKELHLIEKYNIQVLTFLDSTYPDALKQIHLPPTVLYCKGAVLQADYQKNIAVVGARKANEYAQDVVHEIVPELVSYGYTIYSGGALGVDSMAHQAAVESGGKTVVIFGSGLMHPYPESNKTLFREVVASGGTLVSPFPLLSPPQRGNFPARNRVIAGLSFGCLVVQAAKKSGALITAQIALDEGRQVFAVPGSIYDELSVGCHKIITQGAKLVGSIEDILEECDTQSCKKVVPKKKRPKDKKKSDRSEKQNGLPAGQDELILYALSKPMSLDEIAAKTNLSFEVLQNALFDLQLAGKVKQSFSGFWERR